MTTTDDNIVDDDKPVSNDDSVHSALNTTSDNSLERETVIVQSDGDPLVRISTFQATTVRHLTKDPRYTTVHISDDGKSGEFTIPAKKWTPWGGPKRERHLTDEQRTVLADRLRRSRQRYKNSA